MRWRLWCLCLCAVTAWPGGSTQPNTKRNTDLYSTLGVPRDASQQQIKKAYRALSKQYHPDIDPSKEATDKFKAITKAYEILSDEKKRAVYDKHGESGLDRMPSEEAGFASMFDFFGDGGFFGGAKRPRREKADDVNIKLYLTLEQFYKGETLHIAYKRPVVCMHADECIKSRPDCIGPGTRMTQQRIAPGYMVQTQTSDATCVDKKKGWTSGRCRKCPEGPLQIEETILMAFVEPGMQPGDHIRFEGAGEQTLSLDPGDLFLILQEEQEKDKFIRDLNNNLHTQLFITLAEALLGFNTTIPHVSGVPVQVSRDALTLDGDVIRIPGKGLPKKNSHEYGDLLVKLKVRYPSKEEMTSTRKQKIRSALEGFSLWNHLASPNGLHSQG
eukprot:Blabericola_migrator_1__9261@NODE_497_length_8018_cov_163_611747_g381_i0_p2_GENE_NODE_497_length_8018_cov_163_611747_g381_i0NODE_497_length_8018_cov_163_611747_g381_i0_p2_ORF_typecomplete_len386_score79_12DnaJ_C/PF01556_18/1_3e37DnaJ/PF00226_31/5_3e24DnaJ/PF00226_31/6_9e03Tnp_22_trimer/PF17489_2/2_2e03Tnp_22_trimer/PF17489_2/1_9Tnp_22_trimer/PF17489_2/2_1e03DnaJ_CXXCXGXG/PF00684_19/1_2_NODE_497_length_8018_cov_163_611747_g381_i060437200